MRVTGSEFWPSTAHSLSLMCVIGIYCWPERELTWRYALSDEGAVGTPQKLLFPVVFCLALFRLWPGTRPQQCGPCLRSFVPLRSQSRIIRASCSCLLLSGTCQQPRPNSRFHSLGSSCTGECCSMKKLCNSCSPEPRTFPTLGRGHHYTMLVPWMFAFIDDILSWLVTL